MLSALTVSGGAMIIPLIALNVYLHHNRDPLILDLDGDGIELTALGAAGRLGASSIYFDYARDGFAERTGWAAPDDGMLAIDANGNGIVDDISELFGSPTQDGFAVLETLDTNQDGVIDQNDARFGELRVWRDLNQNGVTDAGELQTLAEAGLASISLSRTDVTRTNAAGHNRRGSRQGARRHSGPAAARGKWPQWRRYRPGVIWNNGWKAVVTTAFYPVKASLRARTARSTTNSVLAG